MLLGHTVNYVVMLRANVKREKSIVCPSYQACYFYFGCLVLEYKMTTEISIFSIKLF